MLRTAASDGEVVVCLKEQSWLGWGWELPLGEGAVLEPS